MWQRYGWWFVCFAVLALACAARLYHITYSVLWLDEAYSVRLANMPLTQIIHHTLRDVHPPLSYVLLHYWIAVFGDSLWSVRFPSAVLGSLSVAVAMVIAARIANRNAALVVGVLFALLPIAVRYSQETRMYALLGLLLLGATLLLMCWVARPERYRYLVGYGLLMSLGLYTHYFTVLCAAAHWLYLLCIKDADDRRPLCRRPWWLCNIMIALTFLPWLPSMWGQVANRNWIAWIPPVTLDTLPRTVWIFLTLDEGRSVPGWLFWMLPLVVVLVCVAVVVRDKRPWKPTGLILSFSYVPLLLAWLVSCVVPLYFIRFLSFAAPGLPILIGLLLAKAVERSRLALVLVAACVAVEMVSLGQLYSGKVNTNGADWREARLDVILRQVGERYRPGDLIVVRGLFWYYSADFYNHTGSELLVYDFGSAGDSSGQSPSSYGWPSLVYPQSQRLYVPDMSKLAPRSGRVWWVGVGSLNSVESAIPNGWKSQAQLDEGTAFAVLYATAPRAEHQR